MSLVRNGGSEPFPLQATAVLLAAVWFLGEARILWPSEGVSLFGGIAMALFLVPGIVSGRRATKALTAFLLSTSLVLAYAYEAWPALWSGFERAVLLAALLPTLSLLRIALQKDLRIDAYRRKVEATTSTARPVWILSGSYVTASLLSVGSISIFAALLPPGAPEESRLRDARAGVCGSSLAILWSPFFIALALVTEYLPEVSLAALIATGLGLSVVGMAIAFRISGAAGHGGHTVLNALGALRGFALPIAAVTVTLIAVRTLTGFSTIETMLVVLPVLCAILLATPPRLRFGAVLSDAWSRLCRIQDEAAIVGAATIFGTVLTAVPWINDVASPAALGALPAPVLVFGCMGFMIGAGFLGLLPMVTGTVALVVLTGMPNALSDIATGLSVLAGWSFASMASVSSMMVLIAAGQYDLSPERLVLGRNLRFLLVFMPLCGFAIALVNAIT